MKFAHFDVQSAMPSNVGAYNSIAGLNLDNVRHRIHKEQLVAPELLEDAVDEYRKFLFLVSAGNSGMAMCSKEVDEVWHNHILFTEDYKDFCTGAYHGFLHHRPATPNDPVDPEGVYLFHSAYTSVFGPLHPIWGLAATGKCIVKPPFCDGHPPQCEADCGCKCKGDDDDDDDDD